ncbi:senescence-associated protein-domain-containing protein [Melampsora americana]|nr:senescence-associated protein-domain-containing protein [Melampsora americana]
MSEEESILLSLPNVTLYQKESNQSNESMILDQTHLNIKLLDLSSNTLINLPENSNPPSYQDLDNLKPTLLELQTFLVLSFDHGLIEIPLKNHIQIRFDHSTNSYLIPIQPNSNSDLQNHHDHHHQTNLDSNSKLEPQHECLIRLKLNDDQINHDLNDTFDNILSSYTNYSGKTSLNQVDQKPFNQKARLALMDEKTGMICGELESEIIVEDLPNCKPSSSSTLTHIPTKPTSILLQSPETVIVSLPSPGSQSSQHASPTIKINSTSSSNGSSLLEGADLISRGIVTGADILTRLINSSSSNYLSKATPAATPMTFSPTAKSNSQRILTVSKTANQVSSMAIRLVGGLASKVGDQIGKSTGIQHVPGQAPPTGTRGYVHNGIRAVGSILESVESNGKKVLSTASSSAASVVRHKYGEEAGQLADNTTQSIQHVALVYIDATGMTRKALLRSAGKAAVRGRMKDGREVIFGNDENVNQWNSVDPNLNHQKQTVAPPLPPRKT